MNWALSRQFYCLVYTYPPIYTWNGSTTEIFNLLKEHCGRNTHVVQLTENYRSSRSILEVGHEALMQNKRRAPKQLLPRAKWAHDEDLCSPPLICVCGHPDDEACAIADEIELLLGRAAEAESALAKGDIQPQEIAVLFRCFNFQAAKAHHPLTEELARRQIPFYVVRDKPLWERAFALDLLAYLHIATNDAVDDAVFLRALARPARCCGPSLIERLLERQRQASEENTSNEERHKKPGLMKVARELIEESAASWTNDITLIVLALR